MVFKIKPRKVSRHKAQSSLKVDSVHRDIPFSVNRINFLGRPRKKTRNVSIEIIISVEINIIIVIIIIWK